MRLIKTMLVLALLLDGAMYLQHHRAAHTVQAQQSVGPVAEGGDLPVLSAR